MTDLNEGNQVRINTGNDPALPTGIENQEGEIFVYDGDRVSERHRVPLLHLKSEKARLEKKFGGDPNVTILASATNTHNTEDQVID